MLRRNLSLLQIDVQPYRRYRTLLESRLTRCMPRPLERSFRAGVSTMKMHGTCTGASTRPLAWRRRGLSHGPGPRREIWELHCTDQWSRCRSRGCTPSTSKPLPPDTTPRAHATRRLCLIRLGPSKLDKPRLSHLLMSCLSLSLFVTLAVASH
jgi:hypothetical protein